MLASIVGTVLTVLEPEKDERLIYTGRMRSTCTKEQLTAKGTPLSGMTDISREDEGRAPVTLFPSLIQLEPLVGLLIFFSEFSPVRGRKIHLSVSSAVPCMFSPGKTHVPPHRHQMRVIFKEETDR